MDGWTVGQTDGRTDGQMEGLRDGRTNGPTIGESLLKNYVFATKKSKEALIGSRRKLC